MTESGFRSQYIDYVQIIEDKPITGLQSSAIHFTVKFLKVHLVPRSHNLLFFWFMYLKCLINCTKLTCYIWFQIHIFWDPQAVDLKTADYMALKLACTSVTWLNEHTNPLHSLFYFKDHCCLTNETVFSDNVSSFVSYF